MAVKEELIFGTQWTPLAGANLQNMANNALVVSAARDNSITYTAGGASYPFGRITLNWKFQSAPAVSSGFSIWILTSEDAGTSYQDGSTSITPQRSPDGVIPTVNDTNAHQDCCTVELPAAFYKVLIKNDSTGFSLTNNSTDNFLKLIQFARTAV